MPAFLTHWHVLIETARRSQDAGGDLGSLIVDTTAIQRRLRGLPTPPQTTPAGAVWNTGPLPRIDYHFPGSDISALAYLGALAPDVTHYQRGHFRQKLSDVSQARHQKLTPLSSDIPWAVLLHTHRSGAVVLALLEQIAELPSPALRSQALAFCLGYLTHFATDIALNPWINVLASKYQSEEIVGLFLPFGVHSYIELCLDEYIAATYFKHDPYAWIKRPWNDYIEPVAQSIASTTELTAQVLNLLTTAIATTYTLSEKQCQHFRRDYIAGLLRLRRYLAGRGAFRWVTVNAQLRNRTADPIIATIAAHATPGTISIEDTIAYAIRLSERLCRRAIGYYASLRNTNATAEERGQRRTALREDLHNWDLNTGYTLEVRFEQEVTLRYLHNWIHFADLWERDAEDSSHSL